MLSLSRFDCKRRRRVRHAIEGALRFCTYDDANGEALAERLEVLKSRAVVVSVGERLRSDKSLTFGSKPSNWAAFVGKNIASSLILRVTDRRERGKRPEFSVKRIYSYKILGTGNSSSLEEQDLATAWAHGPPVHGHLLVKSTTQACEPPTSYESCYATS